jgi:hypothetical protein
MIRERCDVDQSPTNDPMDDDQPLFLPAEFEREHLDEARRVVSSSRGGRAMARRVTSAAIPQRGGPERTHIGVAVLIHAVAALLLVIIALATGTWAVGLAMLGMLAISLAVVIRVLHVMAQNRVAEKQEPDRSRPHPRRPR